MDGDSISALFESRLKKLEAELDSLRSCYVSSQTANIHLTNALALLSSENSEIRLELSTVTQDLRILHPMSYRQFHKQKCIKAALACKNAIKEFSAQHSLDAINTDPSLDLQLRELQKAEKASLVAQASAAHLCELPPTFEKVLCLIAERGYTEDVKKFLNLNRATRSCGMLQKAMREVKNDLGKSQLSYFANQGLTSSVTRMLLMKGIDLESRCNLGQTPLNHAAYRGHIDICKLLLDQGAMIDSTDRHSLSPIYRACQIGNLPIVSLLISRAANLETRSDRGWTPLHIAASNGHLEIVKALIANGADMNALTTEEKSARGMAKRGCFEELASYLAGIGAIDDDVKMVAKANIVDEIKPIDNDGVKMIGIDFDSFVRQSSAFGEVKLVNDSVEEAIYNVVGVAVDAVEADDKIKLFEGSFAVVDLRAIEEVIVDAIEVAVNVVQEVIDEDVGGGN